MSRSRLLSACSAGGRRPPAVAVLRPARVSLLPMANQEHLDILAKGVEAWNAWRREKFEIVPNLNDVKLGFEKLSGANLSDAKLSRANLTAANLDMVDLSRADLTGANLSGANLRRANLRRSDLHG